MSSDVPSRTADIAATASAFPVGNPMIVGLPAFVVGSVAVLQSMGILNANTTALKLAGCCVLGFAAIGVYLFYDAINQASGGKPLPTGRHSRRPDHQFTQVNPCT